MFGTIWIDVSGTSSLIYPNDWKTFEGELKKKKCVLLPKEQTEWKPYFEQERGKIQEIQETIRKTDAGSD
jgi:hypothetical protein